MSAIEQNQSIPSFFLLEFHIKMLKNIPRTIFFIKRKNSPLSTKFGKTFTWLNLSQKSMIIDLSGSTSVHFKQAIDSVLLIKKITLRELYISVI